MENKISQALISIALLTITFSNSGCSTAIYKNAKYADILKPESSRSEIREEFGEPIKSGKIDSHNMDANTVNAWAFDDFIVNGPIFDHYRYFGSALGTGMTVGMFEPIEIPRAVGWKLKNRGPQFLKVLYDETEHYERHIVRPLRSENEGEQAGAR